MIFRMRRGRRSLHPHIIKAIKIHWRIVLLNTFPQVCEPLGGAKPPTPCKARASRRLVHYKNIYIHKQLSNHVCKWKQEKSVTMTIVWTIGVYLFFSSFFINSHFILLGFLNYIIALLMAGTKGAQTMFHHLCPGKTFIIFFTILLINFYS